jgi:hypothetical protein
LRTGRGLGPEAETGQPRAGQRPARSDRNSIQEIPARDGTLHAEFTIAGAVGFVFIIHFSVLFI